MLMTCLTDYTAKLLCDHAEWMTSKEQSGLDVAGPQGTHTFDE